MKDAMNIRVLLGLAVIFLGFTLFSEWQQEQADKVESPIEATQQIPSDIPSSSAAIVANDLPPVGMPNVVPSQELTPTIAEIPPSRVIDVETDFYKLKIDKRGGNIIYLELKEYPQVKNDPTKGFKLLDRSDERYYIAQTGIVSAQGPDHGQTRATYVSAAQSYKQENEQLRVELFWKSEQGIAFKKVFEFTKGQYLFDVSYEIDNQSGQNFTGNFYGQIQRRPFEVKGKGIVGMQTYQGGALYTPDKKFKKIKYKEMDEGPFAQTITGGWAAMVEHYFISAWIPSEDAQNEYFTYAIDGPKTYNIGAKTGVSVPAGSQGVVKGQLYVGPETTDVLKEISPGLELTVDYGILWPVSQLIFYVMKKIHGVVGNWGWSIILVTIFIKALFYKLSAASYRSMGHLRRVQPKIEQLKERCGEDKQRFSQAMMELYRKEKINPLGGCLPILVQIPVFIALYYVLLESVELRQAPFMLWLQDLSSKDPYYVLPLLMGGSMLLQQRLSPSPPDPMQAKMLMLMPIVFTFLFLSFPSGLVLYWVANNVLSITQQYFIMRNLEKEGLGRKPKKAVVKKT